ncbi:glutamine synthetase [Azospirillum sp. RWY-5-1]|uniref:Glutamine synthetase n=1 Tax=Azospirillum oleiclasticum TaxID=2735135 RepID=A0ABX2TCH4_9PROT|nr:glutamine synthetase family protein [Azospirillum oleiclasticum]NYZ13674.1 glutamine synthetase [Azospirillum oleiclasticum]NYZ20946.1 glutamine synthetase [Azospirillum oleiclasticum]
MADPVDRPGPWSAEQEQAALRLVAEIDAGRIEVVRFLFADQHGVLRGKALVGAAASKALRRGVSLTTTLIAKDTSHRTVFPVFTTGGGFDMPQMQGASDLLLVPDPSTWRALPWAPNNAWILCDLHFPDGTPVSFCSRRVARRALGGLAAEGVSLTAGLEVEFHLFRVPDRNIRPDQSGQPGMPPEFGLLSTGAQYLTEVTYDAVEPVMEIFRRQLLALGLPLASMEVEFGPSQFEFTFAPTQGIDTADNMVLFRTAMKEIARRHGLHATFMCRPRMPNAASSGWHLHQSLTGPDGRNLFVPEAGEGDLSAIGRHYLAGLLAHAPGAAVMAAPTINAYKRYRAYSLAPDRVVWARDNRGAMIRMIGGAGDPATRLENRVGEPAANPYLYLASQAVSGLDGLRRRLDPGPAADVPYEAPGPVLPRTLGEAVAALRADPVLAEGFGEGFVDYYARIKEAEIRRFESEVSEWEHREYFDLF